MSHNRSSVNTCPPPNRLHIYLAGALFTQGERNWINCVAAPLRRQGFEVFIPHEHATMLLSQHPDNLQAVFDANCFALNESDIIVAALEGPDVDSGTAWECGYAF